MRLPAKRGSLPDLPPWPEMATGEGTFLRTVCLIPPLLPLPAAAEVRRGPGGNPAAATNVPIRVARFTLCVLFCLTPMVCPAQPSPEPALPLEPVVVTAT